MRISIFLHITFFFKYMILLKKHGSPLVERLVKEYVTLNCDFSCNNNKILFDKLLSFLKIKINLLKAKNI